MTKKIKRAIALSGGGPLVGIQVGALKALEEAGVYFDVWSCGCVGSWIGCLYASLPEAETKKYLKLENFFRQIFVPDDIYASYPIATGAFIPDYLGDFAKWAQKLCDPATYTDLLLPSRIAEWQRQTMISPPKTRDEANLWLSHGLALNPWMRLSMQLSVLLPKSGVAGLVRDTGFIESHIDFKRLQASRQAVYINAYNLEKRRIELFSNRDPYTPITPQSLMAGSSVLYFTENRIIDDHAYCEGAVVDTVNFRDLIENYPDLNEIWVIRITEGKQIHPPRTLIEAQLLSVMLLFNTIAEDDVKLFKQHLKAAGRDKDIRVIEIPVSHQDVSYQWNYANLERGMRAGEAGARKTLTDYLSPK